MGTHFSTPEEKLFASLEWSALFEYAVSREWDEQTRFLGQRKDIFQSTPATTSSVKGTVYHDSAFTTREWQALLPIFTPSSTVETTVQGGIQTSNEGDRDNTVRNDAVKGVVAMCTETISRALSSFALFNSHLSSEKCSEKVEYMKEERGNPTSTRKAGNENNMCTSSAKDGVAEGDKLPGNSSDDDDWQEASGAEIKDEVSHAFSSDKSPPYAIPPPVIIDIHHVMVPVIIYLFAYWTKEITRAQWSRYLGEAIQYQDLIEEVLLRDISGSSSKKAETGEVGKKNEDRELGVVAQEEEEGEEEEGDTVGRQPGKRKRLWKKVKGLGAVGVEKWQKNQQTFCTVMQRRSRRTAEEEIKHSQFGDVGEEDGKWRGWNHVKLVRASSVLCGQVLIHEKENEENSMTESNENKDDNEPKKKAKKFISSTSTFYDQHHDLHERKDKQEREQLCYDACIALYEAAGNHCIFRVCSVLLLSLCASLLPYERLVDLAVSQLRSLWQHIQPFLLSSKNHTAAPHPSGIIFLSEEGDYSSCTHSSASPTTMMQCPPYYATGCHEILCLLESALISQQLRIQAMHFHQSHSLAASVNALLSQQDLPLVSSYPETGGEAENRTATPPLASSRSHHPHTISSASITNGKSDFFPSSASGEHGNQDASSSHFSTTAWDRYRAQYVGQDIIWNTLRTHFSTINTFDADKPTVILLFGPSGLGKSELAKCLTSALHNIPPDELEASGKLVHIHMPSFCTKDSIYSLVDPPAAHVGDGILLSALIHHPDAVVVLDEFEKTTTSAVQHLWLSAFQKQGVLRSLKVASRSVKTTKTTFVLTCNLASDSILKQSKRYLEQVNEEGKEVLRQQFIKECRQACRELLGDPFVNRVDFFFPVLPYSMQERETFILQLLMRVLYSQRKKGRFVAPSVTCVRAFSREQLTTFHGSKVEEIVRQRMMAMVHHGWTHGVLTAVKGIRKAEWDYVLVPVKTFSTTVNESLSTSSLFQSKWSRDPTEEGCKRSAPSEGDPLDTPCTIHKKRIYWNELPGGNTWLEGWFPPWSPPSSSFSPCDARKENEEREREASSVSLEKSNDAALSSPTDEPAKVEEQKEERETKTDLRVPWTPAGSVEGTLRHRFKGISIVSSSLPRTTSSWKAPASGGHGECESFFQGTEKTTSPSKVVSLQGENPPSSLTMEPLLTVVEKDPPLELRTCAFACETEKEKVLLKENNLLRDLVKEKDEEIEVLKKKMLHLEKALGIALLTIIGFSLFLSLVVGVKMTLLFSTVTAFFLVVLKVPLYLLWSAVHAVYKLLGPLRFFGLCFLLLSLFYLAFQRFSQSC